ncbi:Chromatin modification-related protein EAF1 [Lachnellula suecica]|uniref:Vacuolar import and degradation protein 21 n=1 Tax=Lachnellula suecica TaxID=602035 RepID=A0A8T9C269_9HELO|nr:Chromatin modification-related protein EAF1 [Lachnellula suecica]
MSVDRERLLRSKRSELSGIVVSRKRKLREFFAVCDHEGPLPQIALESLDAPPTTAAEKHFLEVSDIVLNRPFDESNLPTRRRLRSQSQAKQRSPIRKASPEARSSESSRKATKAQRDASRTRKSRATTPSAKSEGSRTTPVVEIRNGGEAALGADMRRSSSKGSQTDLPVESSAILDEIVKGTFDNATRAQSEMPNNAVSAKDLESDRIRTVVESRPNSPGVDPRKAMPISAEDAAQLDEPLVDGLGSHDTHHKAATVHLPPKEVQERNIRERERARELKDEARHLSINLPPRDSSRNAEPLSSPGSTVDAQSATTPALHDASTDTSPENDNSRYDAERLDKDDEAQTPPALRPTPEEVAEKEEHDGILNAQIEVSRAEILGSSPTAADNQLRMEEQAASLTEAVAAESQLDGIEEPEGSADRLTKEASEVVQDIIEDEDKVVAVPTPEDAPMSGVDQSPEKIQNPGVRPPEVDDSEAEADTPVNPMDVEAPTVKDSFDSIDSLESRAAPTPSAPEPAEESSQAAVDHQKSSSSTPAVSTPRRTPSIAAGTPTLERMTTRVSSGAIRHKSVNEILGEIPKPNATTSDRSPSKLNTDAGSENSNSPSRSTTPQSPGTRMRSLAKERERSKLSTVTFSRRTNKSGANDAALMPSGPQSSKPVHEDYFKSLFIATAASDQRGVPRLDTLLATAHKTITTSNAYVPFHETQTVKVLKRIYQLQSSNKWTLRQPKRAPEPNRPTTQWDVLLQEAKWMRTDFREERKWKMTVANNMASACAEWVAASPEDRKLLQVNATSPPILSEPLAESSKDTEMMDATLTDPSHATPDLVASGEFDSPMDDFDEEPRLNLMETVATTAIFGLQDDDVVFGLRRSPTSDKLLAELPMFGAPLTVPQSDIATSEIDPDRFWRRPALPLSKYVEGRMELKSEGPPRKKSRFQYEEEDDDEDEVVFGDQGKRAIAPPETTEVALFNPEHKHIRDRIHSSHQFRPPSEFPMPLQSFFETRIASQWTWDEDNELKTLVREYSYNWSLISSMLSSKSAFSSGAERRTPWECFERWIHLEGLPADMQKTHYFRAYTTRIEAANRNVLAQVNAAQPGPLPSGQIQPPPRRRTTTSVRVERRRNQKHLTLVDAMRKLAKKRETTQQKQQQAAGMAALRKANENQNPQPRGAVHTPQDFSRMKHERDEQFKERLAALHQRQEAQRRAVLAQQRNPTQNPQQPGLPNGGPQPRGPPPANGALPPNGAPNTSNQNLTVPGQNRPPRPIPPQMGQPISNGLRVPQLPMNGMQSGPMQGMQPQIPMQASVGLVTQAAQTAENQRALIQMQQQQGKLPGQSPLLHNSPPRPNGVPQSHLPIQNMMAFGPNTNGISTPPMNGMVSSPNQFHGQAGSPRMGQLPYSQQSQPNAIARMEADLRQQHPNVPNDQIMAMMTDRLKRNVNTQQQQQRLAQSAMNAAAGSGLGDGNSQASRMLGASSPQGTQGGQQAYAQMLLQQQESQQKQAQARQAQAASALTAGPGQNENRPPVQGHAHRNSSGSIQSGK